MNQELEVLKLKPEFQKVVKLFRKKWQLPVHGFKNLDQWEKWEEEFITEDEKSYKSEGFPKNYSFKINALNKEVKEISKQLNLATSLHSHVRNYLFLNNFTPDFLSEFTSRAETLPLIFKSNDKEHPLSKDRLFVEVFGNTTKKQYTETWQIIKTKREKLLGHTDGRKITKSFERDKRVYELFLEKVPQKYIPKIVKEELGVRISYDDVSGIIKRFRLKLSKK